ncbi:Transmembrane protein 223 [Chionoecetes opilio]|uniref:Transmembrane protein 223 n=1 Tax=Chionoecetes opilio TaxID=41210 RepID=A0A8J4YH32_CHIOP|nr:Transmembrane protein 223 [Chionoecetes opilio]
MELLAACRVAVSSWPLLRPSTALGRAAGLLRRHLHTGRTKDDRKILPSGPTRSSSTRHDPTKLVWEREHIVEKDTLLYRNDSKKFFRMINFFGVSQFVFWSYLSNFAFTTMKNVQIPEEHKQNKALPWWKKTDFGQYRNGITVSSFLIGGELNHGFQSQFKAYFPAGSLRACWGTMAICWMYTLRSVSGLVLKRGGRELLFFTFAPLGRNRSMLVPLEKVSAKQSRISSHVHLPLKVQGKTFHYLIDMKGTFTNAKLFDYSAGLSRKWAR